MASPETRGMDIVRSPENVPYQPHQLLTQKALAGVLATKRHLSPDKKIVLGMITPEEVTQMDGSIDDLVRIAATPLSVAELYALIGDKELNQRCFEYGNRGPLVHLGMEIASRLGKAGLPFAEVNQIAKTVGGSTAYEEEFVDTASTYFGELLLHHPDTFVDILVHADNTRVALDGIKRLFSWGKFYESNENHYTKTLPTTLPKKVLEQMESYPFTHSYDVERVVKCFPNSDAAKLHIASRNTRLYPDTDVEKMIDSEFKNVGKGRSEDGETLQAVLLLALRRFGPERFTSEAKRYLDLRNEELAEIEKRKCAQGEKTGPDSHKGRSTWAAEQNYTSQARYPDPASVFYTKEFYPYLDALEAVAHIEIPRHEDDSAYWLKKYQEKVAKNKDPIVEMHKINNSSPFRTEFAHIIQVIARNGDDAETTQINLDSSPIFAALMKDDVRDGSILLATLINNLPHVTSSVSKTYSYFHTSEQEARVYGNPRILDAYMRALKQADSHDSMWFLLELPENWVSYFNEQATHFDQQGLPISRLPALYMLSEQLKSVFKQLDLDGAQIDTLFSSYLPVGHMARNEEMTVVEPIETISKLIVQRLNIDSHKGAFYGDQQDSRKMAHSGTRNGGKAHGTLINERTLYREIHGQPAHVSFNRIRIVDFDGRREVEREYETLDQALNAYMGKQMKELYLKTPFIPLQRMTHKQKTLILAKRAVILAETADALIKGETIAPDMFVWLNQYKSDKAQSFLPQPKDALEQYKTLMIDIIKHADMPKFPIIEPEKNGRQGWTHYKKHRHGTRIMEPKPNDIIDNILPPPPTPPKNIPDVDSKLPNAQNGKSQEQEAPTPPQVQEKIPPHPDLEPLLQTEQPDTQELANLFNAKLSQLDKLNLRVSPESIEKELKESGDWKEKAKELYQDLLDSLKKQQEEQNSASPQEAPPSNTVPSAPSENQTEDSPTEKEQIDATDLYLGTLIQKVFSAKEDELPPISATRLGVDASVENVLNYQEWAYAKLSINQKIYPTLESIKEFMHQLYTACLKQVVGERTTYTPLKNIDAASAHKEISRISKPPTLQDVLKRLIRK